MHLKQQIVEDSQNAHAVEDYLYDDLHRLTHSTQTINGVLKTPIITSYDAVGNIVSKSDYATGYQAGDMAKTHNNAGPNAVYELNKVGAGTVSFNYDAKGNMTSGDGKTITYNSFNKPLTITRVGITSSFSYGANQMRYKQVKTGIPGGDETTIYIDKAYEIINHNGVTTKRLYLGDSIITETGNGTGFKIGFVHRDRLGSVVTISDENGNVVDNKSFDPFGKPRKSNLEEVTPATLLGISLLDGFELHTNRGFTDHEHLDDAQLIHMNGRVYDYNLGRFLSIDPFIQSPGNSQSMNPYSYIMNNPLAGTDPSGYVSCDEGQECDIGSQSTEGIDSIDQNKDGSITINNSDGTSVQVNSISKNGASLNFVNDSSGVGWKGSVSDIGSKPQNKVEDGTSQRTSNSENKINDIAVSDSKNSTPENHDLRNSNSNQVSSIRGSSSTTPSSDSGSFWSGVGNILGKIWNLPNSIIGLGVSALTLGADLVQSTIMTIFTFENHFKNIGFSFGNNAFQVRTGLNLFGNTNGGLTIGNVILYNNSKPSENIRSPYAGNRKVNLGRHEGWHTKQGERLGLFYLPAMIFNGIASPNNRLEIEADDHSLR